MRNMTDLPFNLAITSVLTSAYIIVFPLALSVNTLLIYIVLKRPTMKTTTNYLFANMAAVNLLITIFVMPYAVRYLFVADAWFGGVPGQIACRLVHFAYGISIAGSILSLLAISLDQFYAILFPMKRVAVIRNTRLMTGVIWISSIVLMSPYLAMFGVREITGQHECIYVVLNRIIMKIHFSFTFVFLYAFPLLFMATMYVLIGRKLWLRTIPGNIHSIHRQAAELSKRRVIRMLIIVIATFALCWLPVHVFHMCMAFEPHVTKKMASHWWSLLAFIAHANSAVNPCLEIALNRKFRAELLKLWTAWRTIWMRCFRKPPRQERSCQSNSRITKICKFKSIENFVEGIARNRGTLYDLNFQKNTNCESSPISLVQFTYYNSGLHTDN